ncbi:hypothetical protein OS187_14080, partial [Xanthomonadaceae bacterium JHOS43]|nr:hypothetical protein [Xanthomonadaceae bacterium JHOS43]
GSEEELVVLDEVSDPVVGLPMGASEHGYGLREAVFVEFEDAPAVAEQEVGLGSGSEADDSAVSDAVASSSVDDLIRGWLGEEAVQSVDAPLVPDMEPDTAP